MRSFLIFLCLFTLIFFLSPLLCLNLHSSPVLPPEKVPPKTTLPSEISHNGNIVKTADLILGIVADAGVYSYQKEAVKATAVAVTTQVLKKYADEGNADGFSLLSPEEAKAKWGDYWFSVYWPALQEAVTSVWGRVLTQNGTLAEIRFFPLSWGKTEEDISCPFDETSNEFLHTVTVSLEDFTAVFPRYSSSFYVKTARNGRVDTVTSGEVVLTGPEVMEHFALPSPAFSVKINNAGAIFTCKGVGDGVGMSLYGANEEAKQGKTCEEILTLFYPNTQLGGEAVVGVEINPVTEKSKVEMVAGQTFAVGGDAGFAQHIPLQHLLTGNNLRLPRQRLIDGAGAVGVENFHRQAH